MWQCVPTFWCPPLILDQSLPIQKWCQRLLPDCRTPLSATQPILSHHKNINNNSIFIWPNCNVFDAISSLSLTLIFIQNIVKEAAVIPQDCTMSEKSLATVGSIPNAKVMTGNATAPPPSDVIPATNAPKTMVKVICQRSAKYWK